MTDHFTKPDALVSAQTTNRIFMVRPANFGSNPETVDDNAFQQEAPDGEERSIAKKAVVEFDHFVAKLRAAGVEVLVIEDTPVPVKTDAVFPNNWITTHDDGVVVTYPMYSDIRRIERRKDIIDQLAEKFTVSRLITLEAWEEQDRMLEGTGSMILDRTNRVVYACDSMRTDATSLKEWAIMMRYTSVSFSAVGSDGVPIYHTNVMMALGTTHAVICLEAIHDETERQLVVNSLEAAGKKIVNISYGQMEQFAGNMLELKGANGPVWAMSTAAYDALTDEQRKELQSSHAELVHSQLTTIETYGGGSARCMMAEVFLT